MTQHHHIFQAFEGWSGTNPEGFWMDWIGSKTPDRFTETPWSTSSRGALDYPDFDEEYFEWIDLLESVSDAKSTFVFLELGAGYGRWSARAAHAARQKNKLYRLAGS